MNFPTIVPCLLALCFSGILAVQPIDSVAPNSKVMPATVKTESSHAQIDQKNRPKGMDKGGGPPVDRILAMIGELVGSRVANGLFKPKEKLNLLELGTSAVAQANSSALLAQPSQSFLRPQTERIAVMAEALTQSRMPICCRLLRSYTRSWQMRCGLSHVVYDQTSRR